MEDSTIIWKFLTREYPDNHQVVYLYVCGTIGAPKISIEHMEQFIKKVFTPIINDNFIKVIIIAYLDNKRKQYLKGEIKIKPNYNN